MNFNIYINKIQAEQDKIDDLMENIDILKENMLAEKMKENSFKIGDKVYIEKNGSIKVEYEGVIADFELNSNYEVNAKIYKLKKNGSPSKQIHPNGNVNLEEIKKVIS
jgi:hypothetical protein